jgi:hypothetical protein
MEDFIAGKWRDAVEIGFNEKIAKSASRIVEYCDKNFYNYGHQWRCDVAGKVAILLKPGEGYEWHFDNLDYTNSKLSTSRPQRYWTHIIYLTEGKPFEIGTWNPEKSRVLQTDFSAPEPEEIIARIYPKPGKSLYFPCFMVHRIQPIVDNYRWAFVDFINQPNFMSKSKKDLTSIFNRYFDEHTRSQLLSPR